MELLFSPPFMTLIIMCTEQEVMICAIILIRILHTYNAAYYIHTMQQACFRIALGYTGKAHFRIPVGCIGKARFRLAVDYTGKAQIGLAVDYTGKAQIGLAVSYTRK